MKKLSKEQEMALRNSMFETLTGSHLYGTNTPTSDEDFVGVFVADEEYYFGLEHIDEVSFDIVSKGTDGKNLPDAVDRKYYELRKFVKLALDNNPNILEIMFSNSLVSYTKSGKNFLDCATMFPWKGCRKKFTGYALSQKHKMMLKPDNYAKLNEFVELYEEIPQDYQSRMLIEYRMTAFDGIVKFGKDFGSVGDLNFNLQRKMKDVYAAVKERLAKASHRTDMYTKYGYDTKFGMHLLRLMYEGRELMLKGVIQFPFDKDMRKFFLDVREGKYTPDEVIQMADRYEEEMDEAEKISKLPSEPNYNLVNSLLQSIVKESLGVK